jgi:hypothetical protein
MSAVGGGEERNEDGVDGCAVVAADEEPIASSEYLPAQIQFASVVVRREPAIIEETSQRDALIASVGNPGLYRRFVEYVGSFSVTPFEKPVHKWTGLRTADLLFLFSRCVRDGPLDSK